jgi:ubiquinone/menaquinone biosynthesis C-methylase UbiE
VAESLPFGDGMFDFVLMVAVICYLDDVDMAFREARRVLKDNGSFVVCFIERDSPIGQAMRKETSEFYSIARFHSVVEVESKLHNVGFNWIYYSQTLFKGLDDITEIEPVKEGFGEGSFIVVKAVK